MRKKTYKKTVGVLLSEEQFKQLVWMTDQLEMTLSEFIRNAVEDKMNSTLRQLKQERLEQEVRD
jgi:hypothetical protein